MKKTLLFGGLLFTAVFSNAQRLSLYEEFSGENCGPCAATNPGLMTLLDANTTKVLLIKYQTPIPSAGPIYNENTADVNSRTTYYNVPFAPYGRLDGDVSPGAPSGSGNDGHPGYLTQAHIDAAAAVPTNFTFTVTNAITSGTNIVTTVNITSSAAYTNANLKLRVALVEDLSFTTPPGTNGEMVFHHVMRKMLANPINVQSTWTAGGTQSLSTTSVAIPSYVDRTHNVFVIAWIQDETTKKVLQAGKSAVVPPAALDGTVISTTPANGALLCGVTSVPHKVKIQNTGTTAISGSVTSTQGATVIGTQTFTNIAPGAFSAELTMGNATPSGGVVTIQDVVTLTGGVDQNPINNTVVTSAAALTTGGLPQTTSFESATLPAGYLVLDNDEKIVANPPFDGPTWFTHTETGITAQNGTFTAITDCAGIDPGNTTIITFPYVAAPTGAKAVDFYYAYAQRGTIAGDKLEVVYSTDCGQNWTSLWSKSGADLATAPATGSQSLFLPTSASQYKFASVDASAANGDVIMGFRATSGGGNLMYIDNVNYRTGAPTVGIEEIVAGGNFSVYPNPTTGVLNIELTMVKKSDVTISVYNVLGQQVNAPVTQSMGVGTNTTTINTSNLAAGMYYLNIATEAGNIQQKFTKQ